MKHLEAILNAPMGSTILVMEATRAARTFSSRIEQSAIIWQSGGAQMSGKSSFSYWDIFTPITILHRPVNKEELFNLRHASLRNEIEQLFGVLKRCFRILLLAPEYSILIQRQIPAALAALHNFILTHEPTNEPEGEQDYLEAAHNHGDPYDPDHRASSIEAEGRPSDQDVDERRNRIAQEMWDDYVVIRGEMGIPVGGDDNEDEIDEDDGTFEQLEDM